jgi:hypothetical protein
MNSQRFRLATGSLVAAVILLIAGQAWAIYFALGPSKDEWGLKYAVTVEDVDGDTVNVTFTLADEGRLKPIHSITLAVLDKQNSTKNSRRYDVRGKLELKPSGDGKRVGQMKLRKDQVDQAMIRVLTQRVDGKFQSAGAAYYDIPLAEYIQEAASPGVASRRTRPSANVKE